MLTNVPDKQALKVNLLLHCISVFEALYTVILSNNLIQNKK